MSNEYLSDMVMPELLKSESSMVSEPPSPEVTVGNTSGTGVSSLPNSERMVLNEEQWNELFGESKEFSSFEGFSDESVEKTPCEGTETTGRGNNMVEETPCEGTETTGQPQRRKWSLAVNKIVMECYYRSDPSKRGYRKRMFGVWQEKGIFKITEQQLCNQARAIKTNGWLSELEHDEIKQKINNHINIPQEEDVNEDPVQVQNGISQEAPANGCSELVEQIENIAHDCNDDEQLVLQKLKDYLSGVKEIKPFSLKSKDKKQVKKRAQEVNQVIDRIPTRDITEDNSLICAGAAVVCEEFQSNVEGKRDNTEPMWKRRIKKRIDELRTAVSKLERKVEGKSRNIKGLSLIEKKYHTREKGVKTVIEELKQRIVATASKLKRYEQRILQFRQNRLFVIDQKKVYQELDGQTWDNTIIPDAQESCKFWSDIWDQPVVHNEKAEWIKEVKIKYSTIQKQEQMYIDVSKIKQQLRKTANWKAPGPDGVHGYWLKEFTKMHGRIARHLDDVLQSGVVPAWLNEGRTLLCVKDVSKGTAVDNFRPITCLPLLWKLFSGVISEDIYNHLIDRNIFPEEQKGCKKKCRGTQDQLIIDKMVLKNCKRRLTNMAVAWIDYRKAYDMIPHSWIKETLSIFGISQNIQTMMANSMPNWKTVLTTGRENLGEINIRRGIFQGDSLSPLLFVIALIPLTAILSKVQAKYQLGKGKGSINHLLFMDDLKLFGKDEREIESLVNTVRIFSDDIRMEFGLKKCGVILMKRGKLVEFDGIVLPNDTIMKTVDEDGYKYLGILELDDIMHQEMKGKFKKEYYRRVRKVLKSKLNGGNVITAINTWAVAIMRYGAGVINWNVMELKEIDRKTRKLLTMYRMHHPQSDVDRLYLPRKEGGRGLLSVEDCIRSGEKGLYCYLKESTEPLLKLVFEENIVKNDGEEDTDSFKERRRNERHDVLSKKKLHNQFHKATEEFRNEDTWKWLRRGELKKETEGTIFAAQDQSLRTNWIKANIDKQNISSLCRMCGKADETIAHVISECEKLAQKQYKLWRHDQVAKIIHWKLCEKFEFERGERWYDHQPEAVLENEKCKILWDFSIQTDHKLEHNKPDIVVVDKSNYSALIIDIACPFDTRVEKKETEKIDYYQDLKREIIRLWKLKKVTIIPIIIGALGTVNRNAKKWREKIEINCSLELLQKACLLGTAKIIRKVLDT